MQNELQQIEPKNTPAIIVNRPIWPNSKCYREWLCGAFGLARQQARLISSQQSIKTS